MADFSDYLENKILDHVFRNTPYTPPATIYLALYTAAPTDAGGGTQVTGGGYARKAVTFGAAAGGAMANTNLIDFLATGANFGTITHVGVFDALTAGNLLAWKAISSIVINDGDTISFPIGSIIMGQD
ncbi:hypothetical protein [Mesorhizobium sp. M0859]|uniref:phage tail fiber protein n=1 Tax=Mesorhizobium sp. M0859 TaxID=2957014 RepID=UPI00333B211D